MGALTGPVLALVLVGAALAWPVSNLEKVVYLRGGLESGRCDVPAWAVLGVVVVAAVVLLVVWHQGWPSSVLTGTEGELV